MHPNLFAAPWLWVAFFICLGGCEDYLECPPANPIQTGQLPSLLSQTGLYADIEQETLADGVMEFEPAFKLWTDGADKRRWIYLPPDTQIDTSDVDSWEFPVGTKVWKEFARDGVRIETRIMERIGQGDGDWAMVSYVWDGNDAKASIRGVFDAHGTSHNVPGAGECAGCHSGRKSHVLGFSAIQLAGPDGDGPLLAQLVADGRFSDPLPQTMGVPGNDVERAALGYLHANCSHCHNNERPNIAGCFIPDNNLEFHLTASPPQDVTGTAAYRSALDNAITPGQPDNSQLIRLVSGRGVLNQMPPLGTEMVDEVGVQLLREWVEGME